MNWDGDAIKFLTEIDPDDGDVPPHIVGLTSIGEYAPKFLLDTKLGVVYWPECPGEIKYSGPQKINPDPYEWAEDGVIPEDQAEWRASGGVWAITDFFQMLKFHFEQLNFLPCGNGDVKLGSFVKYGGSKKITSIQQVYREYGWPDLACFRKEECHAGVRSMLKAQFPEEFQQYP